MGYTVPSENEIMDSWLFYLPIISTSMAHEHKEFLEIDFDLKEELIILIKNFTISCFEDIKLGIGSLSEAWIILFTELEKISCDKLIHDWVIRRMQLGEVMFGNSSILEGWNALLLRWMNSNPYIPYPITGLEPKYDLILKGILLEAEAKKSRFRIQRNLTMFCLNWWDRFLVQELSIDYKISNCIYDIAELEKWKSIFSKLDNSSIEILDLWCNKSHKTSGWGELHLYSIAELMSVLT